MLSDVAPYLPDLSLAAVLFVVIIVFLAGVLRGFTGFGFGLVAVPTLTLIIEPAQVVPATLIVALIVGAELVPRAWRHVEWRSMRMLLAGAVVTTPFGTYALSALPANVMRGIIGGIVLLAVILLWRGFKFAMTPPKTTRLGIGLLSGLLNGATGMGGPPVIIYFLASPEGVVVGRASLLVFFFFTALWSVTVTGAAGLINVKTVAFAGLMFPFMGLGNWIGNHWFNRSAADTYIRVALAFLAAVAMLALGRAVLG